MFQDPRYEQHRPFAHLIYARTPLVRFGEQQTVLEVERSGPEGSTGSPPHTNAKSSGSSKNA